MGIVGVSEEGLCQARNVGLRQPVGPRRTHWHMMGSRWWQVTFRPGGLEAWLAKKRKEKPKPLSPPLQRRWVMGIISSFRRPPLPPPTPPPPKSGKNRLQAQMSCLSQHCPKLCPLPATLLRTRLHPWSLTVPSVFKQDPVLGRRARDSFRIFCLGWTKYWAGTQDTWIPIPLCRSLLT